jgi:hypothetical protein
MSHFHPQLEGTKDGRVACAYYEFGPKRLSFHKEAFTRDYLIDVILVASTDNAQSFSLSITVTDEPWDPKIDAPWAHGHSYETFIGDYFGLGVSTQGFFPFWTDTRTGLQNIFTSGVAILPERQVQTTRDEAVLKILFGVTNDGSGRVVTPSGRIIIVPPRQPVRDMLYDLAIHELAKEMEDHVEGAKLRAAAMRSISKSALKQANKLAGNKQRRG